jgi:uncharacterized protein (DUF2147 family)
METVAANGVYRRSAEKEISVRLKIVFATFFLSAAVAASGADMVTGMWKTEGGETASIAACGPDYCITAKTGKFAGEKLGTFTGAADSYTGRITDPRTKAVYAGKLTVEGDSLKLRGCATSVLCKTQTWTRLK